MIEASISQMGGHGFKAELGHTKDFRNDSHCLLVWCLTCKNRVGKLSTHSYQPPPPAVAFIAFNMWPRVV